MFTFAPYYGYDIFILGTNIKIISMENSDNKKNLCKISIFVLLF